VVEAFSKGPHIFNLGHGITPDADPENVQLMSLPPLAKWV
ncbi:MAG: uroporphyrinogen decarboxylase family protein, partial [Pseudomonadota bacterium]